MTFEELQLAPLILKSLAECGHHNPTAVQELAIPKVMAGHDLIASAQTGTGKTAAFILPALQRLSGRSPDSKPGLRVLVMTPTRELADQITQVARAYGKYLDVNSIAIVGGMPFGDQFRALAQMPDIIVGTPGRLIDHIWHGRIELSQVELLVIDEADRMLDMGFISDVEFISDTMPEGCQTLLFAATMNDPTAKLARKYLKNPERVEVAPGQITHDKIEQRLHMADSVQHKDRLLQQLCTDTAVTRAIIFSATKRGADSLARTLNAQGHPAAALHADMSQSARNRTIMDMRKGKIRLLVATDVAARGLDIDGISHVINFDLPRSAEDYVNRIGRTGRAGADGIAISLASRGDLPYLDRIESYLGHSLPVRVLSGIEPDSDYPARGREDNQRGNRQAASTGRRSPATRKKPDIVPRKYEEPEDDSRGGRTEEAPLTTPQYPPQDQAVTAERGRDESVHAGLDRRRKPAVTKAGAEGGTGTVLNFFGLPRYQKRHGMPKKVESATRSHQ